MEKINHLIAIEEFVVDRMFLCNICCNMILRESTAILLVFENITISDENGRGLNFIKCCKKCGSINGL